MDGRELPAPLRDFLLGVVEMASAKGPTSTNSTASFPGVLIDATPDKGRGFRLVVERLSRPRGKAHWVLHVVKRPMNDEVWLPGGSSALEASIAEAHLDINRDRQVFVLDEHGTFLRRFLAGPSAEFGYPRWRDSANPDGP